MTRNIKTLKVLREEAEAALAGGVANMEQLTAAVPALVELQNAVESMAKRLKATQEVVRDLGAECAKYALAHPAHVFDRTFSVAPSGAKSGYLAVGERTFHFARRNDGYERTDPALTMTQEFLAALPSDWTRQRLALDRTGIANANATAEQLAENGLVRRVKDLWSEVTTPAV